MTALEQDRKGEQPNPFLRTTQDLDDLIEHDYQDGPLDNSRAHENGLIFLQANVAFYQWEVNHSNPKERAEFLINKKLLRRFQKIEEQARKGNWNLLKEHIQEEARNALEDGAALVRIGEEILGYSGSELSGYLDAGDQDDKMALALVNFAASL